MTTPELYTPKGSRTLDKLTEIPQIRLAIVGYMGTGKTWSGLTFPNPTVLNIDRGLGAHIGRTDVIEVPIYDIGFCKSILPTFRIENLKDVITQWLKTEAMQLTANQTLVVDGSTGLQNAYHRWYAANKVYSQGGQEDKFAQWRIKAEWFGEIMELLKSLKCHVVYISHEIDAKDKSTGSYSGKVRPLLTGQFGDELLTHFTDAFHQMTCEKPDPKMLTPDVLAKWGMTSVKEFTDMMATFPRNTIYYWSTSSDNTFDAKCSSLVNYPQFLPANFKSFEKFRRK